MRKLLIGIVVLLFLFLFVFVKTVCADKGSTVVAIAEEFGGGDYIVESMREGGTVVAIEEETDVFCGAKAPAIEALYAAVTWTDSTLSVEVPAPYVIEFAQLGWVFYDGVEFDPAALEIVTPGWWLGAYNPDCGDYCDDDPLSYVHLFNCLAVTPGRATSRLEFTWEASGSGVVNWGGGLQCNGYFANQPCHLMVLDTSKAPEDDGYASFWYCGDVLLDTNTVVHGAFDWISEPLYVPSEAGDIPSSTDVIPYNTERLTWEALKGLYK